MNGMNIGNILDYLYVRKDLLRKLFEEIIGFYVQWVKRDILILSSEKDHGKEYKAHRIIMEYILGRDLMDDEIVDHINCIRYDNSFSNLRVTDAKGNMNNPLTIEKRIKRVVAADLFGNFICY